MIKYSKDTIDYVSDIITGYFYDYNSSRYVQPKVKFLPDFVQSKLAALIISENEDVRYETFSYENPNFNKDLLPEILSYLMNSSTEKQIELCESLIDCVVSYNLDRIQNLLDFVFECRQEDLVDFTYKKSTDEYLFDKRRL